LEHRSWLLIALHRMPATAEQSLSVQHTSEQMLPRHTPLRQSSFVPQVPPSAVFPLGAAAAQMGKRSDPFERWKYAQRVG
jgi:hypothetical protein